VPLKVEFNQPSRFTIRASGGVTLREIVDMYAVLLAHPGLSVGSDAMVDARAVEGVPTMKELRMAASELEPILHRGLGAICVVTSQPLVYGAARMFSVFAEAFGANVGAAHSEDDAQRWLAERRGTPSAAGK
jgi:hypothetical protein